MAQRSIEPRGGRCELTGDVEPGPGFALGIAAAIESRIPYSEFVRLLTAPNEASPDIWWILVPRNGRCELLA
jgi:hypothetical protein